MADDLPAEVPQDAAPPPRRRGRVLRRVLFALGAVVLAFIALAALLWGYGSMWVPDPAMRRAYAAMVSADAAEPVPARFHIPIPGCVCHSDDPAETMRHSTYRIRECSRCHERVGPQ